MFEPYGVYAGIPYRVLPDSSIEAMISGDLVRFKSIHQLIASAGGARGVDRSDAPMNGYNGANRHELGSSLPASAQPCDYYSILREVIKKTERDSAQLRALIYDRARFNFKRDILYGHTSLNLQDLVRHVQNFELAVSRIEADNASIETESPKPDSEINVPDPHEEAEVLATSQASSNNALQVLPATSQAPMYLGPNGQIGTFKPGQRVDDFIPRLRFANQLVAVLILGTIFIGIVMVAGVVWRSPNTQVVNVAPKAAEPPAPKVSYPLPTSYGIYSLSDNKLTELQSLPINVPDPRVALSAEIKMPSTATISGNNPAFILFRRDLLNNAPQKVTLRVIARMAWETKIVNGQAVKTPLDGAWRIRNISHEYKVSPVPGQLEMVIARPESSNEMLAAGRYALVLNRVGYDFTVAGPVNSAEFCLENFQTQNGPLYNQCRAP